MGLHSLGFMAAGTCARLLTIFSRFFFPFKLPSPSHAASGLAMCASISAISAECCRSLQTALFAFHPATCRHSTTGFSI